ncbi:MAG TPA: hypothetical protein VFL56_06415 [Solirubrobacterales bacterium]|nr:hypothetical protein [Solirubrobacterales bacterium]HEU4980816.1 hypothetical protein [Solirubrobacterales bacterium]
MTSKRLTTSIAVAALAIAALAPAAAEAAQFEGTVIAKNKSARTFTLKQDEGGGTFKIKVTASTKYEGLAGFGAIKVGAKNIEAVARKNAKGRWIASKVERSGSSGGGGGGGDDGPGHT